MSDITIPHIRQRVSIAQTAKGLHQIDCTVELVENLADIAGIISSEQLAEKTLGIIKAVEAKLKEDKRKLVTDEVDIK